MKLVILVLVGTLLSMSVMGHGGGVDVGNHGQKGRFSLPSFGSEEAMVAFVQEKIPAIEKGEHPEVKKLLKKGKCAEVVFDALEVEYAYQYNSSVKKLEKEFTGEVVVNLNKCKRPGRL